MLLVYLILVVLMFVCSGYLLCNKRVLEHFDASPSSEVDVLRVYEKVLQRQPSSEEMANAVKQLKANEITIEQIQGRLMDSDEYQRIIKLQSNTLTPEIEKIIHDKQQLAYISDVYLGERTANIPNHMLMPLRDVYIYLEYNETALRMLLRDSKYDEFEKNLANVFQLSKEKTLAVFDKMFSKADLLKAARESSKPISAPLNDPPALVRTFDSTTDANPSGNVTQVAVAKNTITQSQVVIPAKETFVNYINEVEPEGASTNETVARTIYDKDSDSTSALFHIDQRSKEVFDIHKVATNLNNTPDAFVYLPSISVRYEQPATHYEKKPSGNTDPFAIDLFGCLRAAPI